MNTFAMLIRREFWEHRSLWIAPLVWVGIILVMVTWLVFFTLRNEHVDGLMSANDAAVLEQMRPEKRAEIERAVQFPTERKHTAFALSYVAIAGLIMGFVTIVVFFYLIDCLYAERRDRSILFWKSLPVSDREVVLSKLTVALVVVPLGAVLLAAAMQLVLLLMVWLRFHGTIIDAIMPDWSLLAWLRSQVIIFGLALGGAMWYAPIAGYLLLVSIWARRNVFLWAVLPPLSLAALEGFFFHSTNVVEFLGRRFTGHTSEMNFDHAAFGDQHGPDELPRVEEVFDAFELSGMFTSLEAWLGIAATAVMVYAAIRIRGYRDES